MSTGVYKQCANEAAKKLKNIRTNALPPLLFPEGVTYAGGHIIWVVAINEDGSVK